jgi:soluble lytic murein transglycosylase
MTLSLIRLLLALHLLTLPMVVADMSIQAGVDPTLANCIVSHESNWDIDLVSKDQDTGLFQIIPSTAKWVAEQMGLDGYDLTDPVTNADMGLWVLARFPEWYSTLPLCEEQ